MTTLLHYLNVGAGDCTVIQHPSGRTTMVDICGGNLTRAGMQASLGTALAGGLLAGTGLGTPPGGGLFAGTGLGAALGGGLFAATGLGQDVPAWSALAAAALRQPAGNFNMNDEKKNPLDYLQKLEIRELHRFISTHPEMDHIDGLDALFRSVQITNFWHTGVFRRSPDFGTQRSCSVADWNRYCALRNGQTDGTTVLQRRAGDQFSFASRNLDGSTGGDGIYILAPSDALVRRVEELDDINESSYVLAINTTAGLVVIPGDAHDATWEHVLAVAGAVLVNCALLLAPHHGRDSDRDYTFLDWLRPRLTLMGSAPAEHMGYASWRCRNLPFITNNQAGDVCVDLDSTIGPVVWVENESYARAKGYAGGVQNARGQFFAGIY